MVDKHREKLRKEKEDAALEAVRRAVPSVGTAVCVLALEGTKWDSDAALQLLSGFVNDKADDLAAIQEKRRQLQAAAAAAVPSPATGSHSDSDSSHRRSNKRHRESDRSKGRKSKHRKEKHNSKKTKQEKLKHKKHSSPGIEDVVRSGYGAYGIIREQDFFEKRSEFQAWAIDIQKVDIETTPKAQEKELYKSFMEDFNTATLPHEKYYNLDIYERKKASQAAAKAGAHQVVEKTAFEDEAERKREFAAQRRETEAEKVRDAYNQLKFTAVGKASDMREQEFMRMQMQQAYRLGDTETAEKLKGRLKADEPVWKNGVLQPPRQR